MSEAAKDRDRALTGADKGLISGEMTVTVVIAMFNAEAYIQDCLASVISQSLRDWRCIVVDDGSSDRSFERARALPDERIQVVQQKNRGVSAARNVGLASTKTSFVMFLDADDVLHPTALARLALILGRTPTAAAVFGSFRKVLADGSPYPGEKPLARVTYPSGDVLAAMLQNNFLANGGHVLVRTDRARRAGGFDERLRLSEDWEFWCRLALEGPFDYIGPEPTCLYLRVAPTSSSGGLARTWDAHQPALQAVLENPRIQARFSPLAWRGWPDTVRAVHLWEAARVNFTLRRFADARRMMLEVLICRPTAKRLIQFFLSELARGLDRPILSRYRFAELDRRIA